ncbi:MAG: ABC transporter ATP-binding protein, partial [Alphaproteobacteria bacterium]|nr:ABC transporter ATP-binding protein [Alphaproteobacteria bacterium]
MRCTSSWLRPDAMQPIESRSSSRALDSTGTGRAALAQAMTSSNSPCRAGSSESGPACIGATIADPALSHAFDVRHPAGDRRGGGPRGSLESFDRMRGDDTHLKALAESLRIEGLNLSYGTVAALAEIDLAVAKGEFVALLGPSGCGKTSLLRAVAGFVRPQRGAIRLAGRDVAQVPPRQRNIGIVFQSYALFPHMTAFENVRFGLDSRGVARAEVVERTKRALALVGLDKLADRRPRQLSGGQQQRVALARAIVIEPDILLLDEPLAALDKQLRVQMQTELKSLQKTVGVTSIFVTHDREEAMSMADRIVVMRDGRIRQVATPEALFAAPRDAWVADFIGAGNLLGGALRQQGGGVALALGPGSVLEAEAGSIDPREAVMFIAFDRVRLSPSNAADALTVTSRR